ncbi:MAG: glutamate--cysteine ligase, partial [Polyangiaceae bacterium]|nr:glutamate--cysteine ligase [Polyangiaceae bacterium]
MGLEIERHSFATEDYERFRASLEADLEALARLIAEPGFGEGPRTIGAELELHLVDSELRPAPVNMAVQRAANDPRVALELNRYNLELNSPPFALRGRPFSALGRELEDGIEVLRRAAHLSNADVAIVGILPTLREADVGAHAMTPLNR